MQHYDHVVRCSFIFGGNAWKIWMRNDFHVKKQRCLGCAVNFDVTKQCCLQIGDAAGKLRRQ